MIIPDQPTGSVFVRNFDQGIIETLGAVVRVDSLPSLGWTRNGYWIDDVFNNPTAVPVIFNNPESIFEQQIYPSYSITRTAIEASMQRWHSVKQLEYQAGVSGTEESVIIPGLGSVSGTEVSGYGEVEVKQQAWPHDLYYSIACYARYEHEAIPMMKRILRTYVYYSSMDLIDSLGQNRKYTVFAETGINDIGELVDVADRLKAYSIDIRVEGELDLNDPVVRDTVLTVVNNVAKL